MSEDRRDEVEPADPLPEEGAAEGEGVEEEEPLDGGDLPALPTQRSVEELQKLLGPIRDIAKSYHENSDALRSLAEGQNRLARHLERADRSEAMIRSTRALNDTFRGVQKTQERLMDRLDEEKKKPFLTALAVLGLVAVLVGGVVWYLVSFMHETQAEGRRSTQKTFSNVLGREQDATSRLREQLSRTKVSLARSNDREDADQSQIAALTKRVKHLEELNANLKENQADVASLERENASLGAEKSRLEGEVDRLNRRIEALNADLAKARRSIQEKDQKLLDLATRAVSGRSPASGGDDAKVKARTQGETNSGKRGLPPVPQAAAQDPAELNRVVDVLNGLLLEGKDDTYRFDSIGGIRGKVLYNVVVLDTDSHGKVAKRIESAQCRISVIPGKNLARIQFKNGHIEYYGVQVPFWNDTYSVELPDIDAGRWKRSGLTIFAD